jgi:hypothetical protein
MPLTWQKKIGKTFAVSCKLHEDMDAEELGLCENTQRQALHPADEFEAFDRLASGFVTSLVRQRAAPLQRRELNTCSLG